MNIKLIASLLMLLAAASGLPTKLAHGRAKNGQKRVFNGDLKGTGVKQRVEFSDEGNGKAHVIIFSTEAANSIAEWSKEYNYSGPFPSASFDSPSGIYPITSGERLDILSFLGLSGSAGGLVEVFAWNGSSFVRIGHWGGNNSNKIYRVEMLERNNGGISNLVLHRRLLGQYVMPTIYQWNGPVQAGSFVHVNEDYPEVYRSILKQAMASLHKQGEWWPDAFVQSLNAIVEGNIYLKAYDVAIAVCLETLPRIDAESEPAPKLPATATEAERRRAVIKFEGQKARAKADVYLLVGAVYEIAGEKGKARPAYDLARSIDGNEYEYQISHVREFARIRSGAPLLVRSE